MEINAVYDIYTSRSTGVHSTALHGSDQPAANGTDAAQQTPAGDSVIISKDGALRNQIEQAEKPYEAAYAKGVSNERMESLKAAYRGDQCPVPAQEIAGSILTQVLQMRP